MKVVTGATGFVGAHLVCHLLDRGHAVVGLKRNTSSLSQFEYIYTTHFAGNAPKGSLKWAEADMLDMPSLESAFEGADEVYHCAAVVSFVQSDRDKMKKTNVEGTANVVNACLLKKVAVLCAVSSIAALGREKSGNKISEHTKWADSKHNSNYAVSKYRAELELWRGVQEGLNTVIVNPGVILGVGDWKQGSCKLFDLFWKELPFYTRGVNGYVDVRDVAKAMMMLTEQKQFGQRFILVSENAEMKSLMDYSAEFLQKRKARIEVKKVMAEISWILFSIKSFFSGTKPTITRETARASIHKFYYDNSRVKAAGFTFIPIQETIRYICSALKKYYNQ